MKKEEEIGLDFEIDKLTNSILIKKVINELDKSIYTNTWSIRKTNSYEIEKQKASH